MLEADSADGEDVRRLKGVPEMGWKLAGVLVTILVSLSGVSAVSGKPWTLPRLPDGQPDMQGYWTNGTLTPLERPAEFAGKEFFTRSEERRVGKECRSRW